MGAAKKMSRTASARQALARRWAGREGHWREVITRQQASGQSVAGYCAAAGIGLASFYTWRRRLGLGARQGSAPDSGFIEIGVAAGSGSTGVSLATRAGTVGLARDFDPAVLRGLLTVLREVGG